MSNTLEGLIGVSVGTGLAALADYLGVLDGPNGYKTFENTLFFDLSLGSGLYAGFTKSAGAALAGIACSLLPALWEAGKCVCTTSPAQNATYADVFFQSLSTPAILQTIATAAAGYVVGAITRTVVPGGTHHESA